MTELFSVRSGRGRPVLVVHGGLGLDHTYMRAIDRLSDVAELIYVDVRANGRSPRDGVAEMTLASIADELDALRAKLGFETWTVLGHSFGSFIALTYAIRHPDRLAGLIAVASAPSFAHAPAMLEQLDRRNHPAAAAALRGALGAPPASDAELGEVWRTILPLYFRAWNPRYLAAFAETAYSAPGYDRGNALLATFDVGAQLATIRAPALLIAGDDDFITPVELCGSVLAGGIPDAQLRVIPHTGHFPHLESPAAFDADVRAWLTAASRT